MGASVERLSRSFLFLVTFGIRYVCEARANGFYTVLTNCYFFKALANG